MGHLVGISVMLKSREWSFGLLWDLQGFIRQTEAYFELAKTMHVANMIMCQAIDSRKSFVAFVEHLSSRQHILLMDREFRNSKLPAAWAGNTVTFDYRYVTPTLP